LEVSSHAFDDIVDKAVEGGHRIVGDASIGVDLLEDRVDVREVSFFSPSTGAAALEVFFFANAPLWIWQWTWKR